jgi:glycosyltransferase involved in cell wall biosynthesis
MKNKILHISISNSSGGAAIASNRLHKLMSNHSSFSSKMLVLMSDSTNDSVIEINKYYQIKTRILNLLNNVFGWAKKSFGMISFNFFGNDLSNNFLIIEADVIYLHWINNGMLSWSGINKILELQKPTFLFCHDMWYFSGGCHQSNGCDNYEIQCQNCHFFSGKLKKKYINNSFLEKRDSFKKFSNVDLIVPSSSFYEKASSSKIIENSRIHFIPNIIDTKLFTPNSKKNNNKINILYGAMGGKSNPYKGWNDFVYFANAVKKKYEKLADIHLFGYDFSNEEIQESTFEFHDHGLITDENKLIEMYQNMDVFLFPSNQESFGQTLIEAMSCGVVPISYKVGIADDLIENDVNGFLVDTGDLNGLTSSFDKLLTKNLNKFKIMARKKVVNYFSENHTIEKHFNLINSLKKVKKVINVQT